MKVMVNLVTFGLYLGLAIIFWRTPLFSDDYLNADDFYQGCALRQDGEFDWTTFVGSQNKVTRLYGAVKAHYMTDNGRIIPAVFVRLFSPAPRVLFAIVGSLFFWLLVTCIRSISGVSRAWEAAITGIAFFTLLQEDAVIWLTGSMAYAWPMSWTLVCVWIFTRSKLTEAPLGRNGFWMWILMPLMFVAALGHEVIGVPLGAVAAIYWLYDIWRYRRLRFNGRLLMSIGYALGLIALVFSPGTMQRSAAASSVGYIMLSKICVVTYGLVVNPWFYVAAFVLVMLLKRRRHLWDTSSAWFLIAFIFELALVAVFGTIAPRAVWPLIVVTMLCSLTLLKKLNFNWGKYHLPISCICLAFGALTVLSTMFSTEIKRNKIISALACWRNSSYEVCVVPPETGWFGDFLFDRSFPVRETIIWGQSGYGGKWNKALARLNGKKMLYGITAQQGELLMRDDFALNEENLLAKDSEWYYYPSAECLVSRCTEETPNGGYSCELESIAGRSLIDVLVDSFTLRFMENSGGAGLFCTSSFSAAFLRDVIYATIYAHRPFDGFVAEFPSGRYVVLSCNRFRPLARK